MDIIFSIIFSLILVMLTTVLFYRVSKKIISVIASTKLNPYSLIGVLMLGIFTSHAIAIFLYGVALWLLVGFFNVPGLQGEHATHFLSYLYFSATTYSSLGVGDIYPFGPLRFITSVEVINGLTLIAWSSTFTYFMVQKLLDNQGHSIQVCSESCAGKKPKV